MKSLESFEAVTHTQAFLNNVITSDCKTFHVSKNIKNLEYNCK